jgi:CBS domain-containing protein
MRVAEAMRSDVSAVAPASTIEEAAALMDELGVGALPVCDGTRLVGIVTDRDIVVRAVAAGAEPRSCCVGEIMSNDPDCCYEDEALEEAIELMQSRQIRRLAVLNREKELVGMLSLSDVAVAADPELLESGETLAEMVRSLARADRNRP